MASSASRYHHLGRWPMDLHRGIAPPFERIPPIRPDVIGRDYREEDDDLGRLTLAP